MNIGFIDDLNTGVYRSRWVSARLALPMGACTTQKSSRPCENSAAHCVLPNFRGLQPRRAEKIAKIGSLRNRTGASRRVFARSARILHRSAFQAQKFGELLRDRSGRPQSTRNGRRGLRPWTSQLVKAFERRPRTTHDRLARGRRPKPFTEAGVPWKTHLSQTKVFEGAATGGQIAIKS